MNHLLIWKEQRSIWSNSFTYLYQFSCFSFHTFFCLYLCFLFTLEFNLEKCNRAWSFERVIGHELQTFEMKKEQVTSIVECMKLCLNENSFVCRSANYNNKTGDCSLSNMDRHTIFNSGHSGVKHAYRYFAPSTSSDIDYIDNNCVQGKSVTLICRFTFTQTPAR